MLVRLGTAVTCGHRRAREHLLFIVSGRSGAVDFGNDQLARVVLGHCCGVDRMLLTVERGRTDREVGLWSSGSSNDQAGWISRKVDWMELKRSVPEDSQAGACEPESKPEKRARSLCVSRWLSVVPCIGTLPSNADPRRTRHLARGASASRRLVESSLPALVDCPSNEPSQSMAEAVPVAHRRLDPKANLA